MSFTQNRLDFANDITYDEISNAMAYGKGVPSFVVKGLDLTGTTLTNGIFTNTGTFGQLGMAGETHTITANYTGYVIIKSTLNGVNSVSTIELSTTRKDSDPTIVSNIKYFTIYKLNAGEIEEDYRHSSYVKDISFENVGGSSFVQVINGTKSNPFDASTFAGNRTLLDDKDIGWVNDETSVVLLKDDLKTMFDSCQALVGGDKPFILTFTLDEGSTQYNGNFGAKVFNLIFEKYGFLPVGLHTFTMYGGVANGGTSESYSNTNRCTVWSNKNYFEFEFNYSAFDNVMVRDASGGLSSPTETFEIGNGNGTNSVSITLDESIFNFRNIVVRMVMGGSVYKYHNFDVQTKTIQFNSVVPYGITSTNLSLSSLMFDVEPDGLTINPQGELYVNFTSIADNVVPQVNSSSSGIYEVFGMGRLHPIGTTHLIEFPAIETPNIEPEIDNGVRGDK